MNNFPELPPRFQNAFQAAKAKSELRYANRAEILPHAPHFVDMVDEDILIQSVFFEFCRQARNACREGHWTAARASQAVEAAWPQICDSYCVRERGLRTEEAKSCFRVGLWRAVVDDPRWEEHLSDLVTLTEALETPEAEASPSMQSTDGTQHIHKAFDEAIRLFESKIDSPRVQVWMRNRIDNAKRDLSAEGYAFGSKARMEYVLTLFDIRAEAFLELVSDISTQNAFIVALENFGRVAWQEYAGYPLEHLRSPHAKTEADLYTLHVKVSLWTKEGYKRLVSLDEKRHGMKPDLSTGDADHNGAAGNKDRRLLINTFISNVAQAGRRITRKDIWRVAGYDERTQFERFQRGHRRTGQSATNNFTRVLGLRPEQFIQDLEKLKGK